MVSVRVDAHHHLWDLAVRDQDWIGDGMERIRRDFGPVDLTAAVAGTGIERTVLVQTVAVAAETPELLATAATSDLVSGVVGWVDLTAPDVGDRLAELTARRTATGSSGSGTWSRANATRGGYAGRTSVAAWPRSRRPTSPTTC